MVFYCIENFEFCAKFSSARSLTSLFYIKENRCWKSSYSCESLWWTCFIRKNVQILVEIWRCRIAGIAGRRFNSNLKTIGKSNQGTISRRLDAIGKIKKEGKWVQYELKERDIRRRKTTCEILFDPFKRKSFLHRIVTGDEKWIYFDNPKRKQS